MRADAQRNRERVLAAAEAVFAEHGPAVSTELVARRAGVAIGTVFRHFPTKEALVKAVLADRVRVLTAEAASLASADDPGEAFFTFLTRLAEAATTKHAIADAMAEAGIDPPDPIADQPETVRKLLDTVEVLLTRAQRAGAVRPDVGIPELAALIVATSRAAEHTGSDPDLRTRILGIVYDGLRESGFRRSNGID